MAWTDIYPVFDEDLLNQYHSEASDADKSEISQLYKVAKIHNKQEKAHIVSCSLYWKPFRIEDEPHPTPSREILENAVDLGYSSSYDPWEQGVKPILRGVPDLRKKYPEISFRVYLASDLNFLVPDLIKAGCEVCLMEHPSLAHSPGSLWRFLPIGEAQKLVTVCNIDRMDLLGTDIDRTRAMAQANLGVWKVPMVKDINKDNEICYVPFVSGQNGWRGGIPMLELLESFTWHSLRGNIPLSAEIPGCGPYSVANTTWPDYGFDEWFLAAAVYPRAAPNGILNFLPKFAGSMFSILDVEYSTWANPTSEAIFFSSGVRCC